MMSRYLSKTQYRRLLRDLSPQALDTQDLERWSSPGHPALLWERWRELPLANRIYFAGGSLMLALVFLQIIGPPVVAGVRGAIHPFTAVGKQETCLARLQNLIKALEMYRRDYDGSFPPLEYATADDTTSAHGKNADKEHKGKSRVTWVRLLQVQSGAENFLCPTGSSISNEDALSSYGLNPILSTTAARTVKMRDVANAGETLLLADRGEQHELALLPLPGWPAPKSSSAHL